MDKHEEGTILKRDPRKGRRVLYLTGLPETLYGTIETVIRFSWGDSFEVLVKQGMRLNGDAENFALLEKGTPEFYPGEKVKYQFDGKTLAGTVLKLNFFNEDVGVLILFDDGQKITLPPNRLKRS